MLNIFVAILAFATGLYVGSIVFNRETPAPEVPSVPDNKSPMVISRVFRQPLMKRLLVNEVLKPQCYKFMCHFDIPNRLEIRVSKKYEESLNQIAETIMKWYNPEYNELLLIAHRESTAGFVLDWTWKKPSHGVVDELGK